MNAGLVAVALLACGVVVAWPGAGARRRLRPASQRTTVALSDVVAWARAAAIRRPRRTFVVAVFASGLTGLALGPVGALVAAIYGLLGARALVRGWQRRQDTVARAAVLDGLAGLAADLRAGLPPAAVGTSLRIGPGSVSPEAVRAQRQISDRVAAVFRLADSTGAPAADLLERIEADARAADRSRASASAEAAGARVTALVLACLPVAGIALGHAMGSDPLQVLLHTPLGGGCAVGATVLQAIGLLWADRLAGGADRLAGGVAR